MCSTRKSNQLLQFPRAIKQMSFTRSNSKLASMLATKTSVIEQFPAFLHFCKSNSLYKSASTSTNLQPRFTPDKTPPNTSACLFHGISKQSWFVIQHTDPSILTADILRMFNEMHSNGTRLYIRSLHSQTSQEWIFNEMKGSDFERKTLDSKRRRRTSKKVSIKVGNFFELVFTKKCDENVSSFLFP